jgi:hypothetical protein
VPCKINPLTCRSPFCDGPVLLPSLFFLQISANRKSCAHKASVLLWMDKLHVTYRETVKHHFAKSRRGFADQARRRIRNSRSFSDKTRRRYRRVTSPGSGYRNISPHPAAFRIN